MEIFNIHIFEFLLIASLALVVFGPERLPEVGRFVGRQLARFLAWQQQSPELKMINDVRGDFEREIASLRDELVRTRSQLDVSQKMSDLRDELRPMLDLRADVKSAATAPATSLPLPAADAAEAAADAAEVAIDAAEVAAKAAQAAAQAVETSAATELAPAVPAELGDPLATPLPAGSAPADTAPAALRPNKIAPSQPTSLLNPPGTAELPPLPRHRVGLHESTHLDEPPLAPVTPVTPEAENARLISRVESLLADLHALVGELQERGLIGPDWQSPSQRSAQETISR